MKIKFLALFLSAFTLTASAFADDTQPRLVNVTGEGEVTVVPDQVVVNFQVESFDADLAKAKRTNDEAIKKTLAVVKKYKVDSKDFQTDYFTVRNDERYYFDAQSNQQRSKKGYTVTKNVSVRLRDISKFEDFYSEALTSGVNNLYGVQFETSRLEELRDAARNKAMLNAKDKAGKMATAIGETVGRAFSISESGSVMPPPMPRMLMARAEMAQAPANNETIALGQIKISSSVAVSFELK